MFKVHTMIVQCLVLVCTCAMGVSGVSCASRAHAQIFRCDDPVRFQDRPCPNAQILKLHTLQVVQFAEITPDVHVRSTAHRGDTSGNRSKPPRPARRRPSPAIAVQKCAQAKQQLRALKTRRRKGYRLSEEAALDAKRQKQEFIKRQFC